MGGKPEKTRLAYGAAASDVATHSETGEPQAGRTDWRRNLAAPFFSKHAKLGRTHPHEVVLELAGVAPSWPKSLQFAQKPPNLANNAKIERVRAKVASPDSNYGRRSS